MVTRDIQTLWQFVKFSFMVFLCQVFFFPPVPPFLFLFSFLCPFFFFFPPFSFFSFVSNQNVQEGFWD